MADIKFLVTQEGLERHFSMREMVAMQEGNMRICSKILSEFVLDETTGRVMDPSKALDFIMDNVFDNTLSKVMEDFKTARENAVLPPAPAAS